MGIMNYSLVGSDNAADMAQAIYDETLVRLKKRLPKKDNEYNTDGLLDVAMFIEESLLPQAKVVKTFGHEGYRDLAKAVLKGLEEHRKNYFKTIDKLDRSDLIKLRPYYNALRRLKVSVGKFARKMR